ncbi:trypsin-like peptidase domain-containing protein [Candidatus Woesearchaeota archaeon]|nr:trypsin-like peptidase domain-containing protein [Candidatus Woesearchaeota archaeon]
MDRTDKILIAIAVAVLVVFSIQIYSALQLRSEYTRNIATVNSTVEKVAGNVKDLESTVMSQNLIMSKQLASLEDSLQKNTNNLLDIIQTNQQESEQQISVLKSDLKDIKVESADFSAIVEEVLGSVVSVLTNRGQGSGAFIRTSGYIVTNWHVIEGATQAAIQTYDGKQHSVMLVGADPDKDIAVLKIAAEYPFLPTSDDVQVGEKVIALGNPNGLSFTVTEGIVSAVERKVNQNNNIGYIQTDVPISPGSSGGPLVNKQGRMIGMNTFKVSGSAVEGLGFAIPADVIDETVSGIIDEFKSR